MRRQNIEPGRFYAVAIERSGRGGGRIDDQDIVKVAKIEEDDFYTFSTQYLVTGYRALTKGVVRVRCQPRDVLRPASSEETAKWEGYFRLAREHGWIDEEADDEKAAA